MLNEKQRVLNLLGLARKASKLVVGTDTVLKAVRDQSAYLVFFANDGGASQAKKITDKTSYYKVTLSRDFSSEELSNAIGLKRSVVAVIDKNFANKMISYLDIKEQ